MNFVVSSAALVAAPATAVEIVDDSRILALEEQIFQEHELATSHDEEIIRLQIIRLQNVYAGELKRLHDELDADMSSLTRDEIWQRVKALPESIEQTRLVKLTDPHHRKVEALISELWPIRAQTAEGRRAKFLVLLSCIMGNEWCLVDEPTDWHRRMARDLMIEMVGGEPAKQLQDQFA
ncbi:hypothetical protein IVA80_10180 [Bradyrhizobium sp. 139]|uniref:hypothetical protein n=1 Tax=Bradyrhizobium sp. 139 TaxID=2782616 RepID=UPI001FF7E49F|nr:hypothetical protein [Bradyrhizobium sp. 139]MCK1741227.1 hypothetical protein [Bradyrhizobium sp. 139]